MSQDSEQYTKTAVAALSEALGRCFSAAVPNPAPDPFQVPRTKAEVAA